MTEFKDYYCKLTLWVHAAPIYHKNICIDFKTCKVLFISFDTYNTLMRYLHFTTEETEVQRHRTISSSPYC